VTYLKVQVKNLLGVTKENHETLLEWTVSNERKCRVVQVHQPVRCLYKYCHVTVTIQGVLIGDWICWTLTLTRTYK
jgi:hypothetical protein